MLGIRFTDIIPAMLVPSGLVHVRCLPRPSRSMHFGVVSATRTDHETRNASATLNNEAQGLGKVLSMFVSAEPK